MLFKKEATKGKKKASKKETMRSMQDVLGFNGITPSGILFGKNYFSKLYSLPDSNFIVESDELQESQMKKYSNLISHFSDNVDISIVVINYRTTEEELKEKYHLPDRNDSLADITKAYNRIIDEKMKEGNNNISKKKYILLTLYVDTLPDAESQFGLIDKMLDDSVKEINKIGVIPLDAFERTKVTYTIFNGETHPSFERRYASFINETEEGCRLNFDALKRKGVHVKDLVCPEMMARENTYFQIGENRYIQSFSFNSIQGEMDTSFLTHMTNLPYEMVTVIHLSPVPRRKAVAMLKRMNSAIKEDVVKAIEASIEAIVDSKE